MARSFTKRDIDGIFRIIQTWPYDKLTWSDICKASKRVLGFVPTRQALNGHEIIKDAYIDKKQQLKNTVKKTKLPSSLAAAALRLQSLRDENERIKAENIRLQDLLDVVCYNAYTLGFKDQDLTITPSNKDISIFKQQILKELPRVDRGRHDHIPPTVDSRCL